MARGQALDHTKERMHAKPLGRNLSRRRGWRAAGAAAALSPSAQVTMVHGLEVNGRNPCGVRRRQKRVGPGKPHPPGFPTTAGELVVLKYGAQATSGFPLHHPWGWGGLLILMTRDGPQHSCAQQRPPRRPVFRMFHIRCLTALLLSSFPPEQRHPPKCHGG